MKNNSYNNINKYMLLNTYYDKNVSIKKSKIKANNNKFGFIYTLYKFNEGLIILGYTENISYINKISKLNNISIIGISNGYEYDLNLVVSTLNELGYKYFRNKFIYKYSKEFLYHLELIGWPKENNAKYQDKSSKRTKKY